MNSAYMCYYEHLAKLARVVDKKTMFLSHLLFRMEWEKDTRQMVINLSPHIKRQIMDIVSPDCGNKIKMANRYLSLYTGAGILKSLGGSAYLVDPMCYGGHKYVPKQLRLNNAKIYETRVFTEESEGVVESYIVTSDGERVDL